MFIGTVHVLAPCRANPGSLGHLSRFREKFVWVIEKGQKQGSTKRELAEARKGRTRFSLVLHSLLNPLELGQIFVNISESSAV